MKKGTAKRMALFLLAFFTVFAWGCLSYAQQQEDAGPPVETLSVVPEGWTDVGPYYYGIAQGGSLIIHFRAQEILKEKLLRIPYVNQRDRGQKDWGSFSASYIESAVRDIMKINGILDWAATTHELAFMKNADHYWGECPVVANDWVKEHSDVMCNLQDKVMVIIDKAFGTEKEKK